MQGWLYVIVVEVLIIIVLLAWQIHMTGDDYNDSGDATEKEIQGEESGQESYQE